MKNADRSARKALLKEWKASEHKKARSEFPLGDALLGRFFDELENLVDAHGCFHDKRHAQAVIDSLALSDDSAEALLDWCCEHGGLCDCEISVNTFGHWEQCRDRT